MKTDAFKIAAAHAIDEGARERQQTARELAFQFAARPGAFDPSTLERLGEEGLAEFLASIGGQVRLPDHGEHLAVLHAVLTPQSSTGSDFGWMDQRQNEPRWFTNAIMYGLASAVASSIVGSFILNLLNW